MVAKYVFVQFGSSSIDIDSLFSFFILSKLLLSDFEGKISVSRIL